MRHRLAAVLLALGCGLVVSPVAAAGPAEAPASGPVPTEQPERPAPRLAPGGASDEPGDRQAGSDEESDPAQPADDADSSAAQPEEADKSAAEPADADEAATPTEPPTVDEAVVGPPVVDTVLPAGVRVIAAQDDTLPVAAVVLAVETGSEDDPDHLPGLTHALAYHLLQGNREYAPAAITQLASDSGGVVRLATGPGQIRFESLVPVSMLDDMVRAESKRLRAPTINDYLWSDSLTWARRDPHRQWSVPRAALAVAHGATGLLHDGRQVSQALAKLEPRQVAALMADRIGYDRATLVVVAPQAPLATLATVEALFADLPPRPRSVPKRSILPYTGTEPRPVAVEDADGQVFAWPVDAGPTANAWAKIWCRAVNRQRRAPDEPKRARLRCKLDEDPRRGLIVVRAMGTDDPLGLLRARLDRLTTSDAAQVERQRRIVLDDMRLDLRTPLALARTLATTTPRSPEETRVQRGVHELTGLASLREPQGRAPSLSEKLAPARAVHLVGHAAPQEKP